MNRAAALGLAVTLALSVERVQADDKEPLAVVNLGAAGEWGLPGGEFSRGPAVSVEFALIKEWLEVEVGGAKLFRRGNSEWDTDVVFRKPFTLSETTEFMIGLGPMWSKAKDEGWKVGTTFQADAMFWSSPERKYGWFVEPSYSVSKDERSFGVSVGFLIGIH
jgi:hypothetical protein